MKTLPSSDADAMMRSLKGFLGASLDLRNVSSVLCLFSMEEGSVRYYQSVSSTTAVWPRNSGI